MVKQLKILVLAGGTSNERAVSLRSGHSVVTAAKALGYEVVVADPADKDFDLVAFARDVQVVLPILHGEGGEDGSLQQQLEKLGVPFLGTGSAAARLTFNKDHYKQHLYQAGILTPKWQVVDAAAFAGSELAQHSFVLKPICGGSSIDTFIVRDPATQPDFQDAFGRYGQMLLEELVEGSEITVGVLGQQPLPVILIVPPEGKEFDYDNKYNGQTQELVAPTQISGQVQAAAQQLALKVHQLCGCKHFSRTDMIITASGELTVLETNIIPGMTDQSLFPKAAAAAGLDMKQLAARLIELVLVP